MDWWKGWKMGTMVIFLVDKTSPNKDKPSRYRSHLFLRLGTSIVLYIVSTASKLALVSVIVGATTGGTL